jgi:hypothetical protein
VVEHVGLELATRSLLVRLRAERARIAAFWAVHSDTLRWTWSRSPASGAVAAIRSEVAGFFFTGAVPTERLMPPIVARTHSWSVGASYARRVSRLDVSDALNRALREPGNFGKRCLTPLVLVSQRFDELR